MTPAPRQNAFLHDLSRRRLLRAVGFGTAGAAGAGLLSACAGGDAADGGPTRFNGVFDFDLDADDMLHSYAMRILEAPQWGSGFPQVQEIEKIDDLTVRLGFESPFENIERSILKHRIVSKVTYADLGERALNLVREGVRQGDVEHTEWNAEYIEFNPEEIVCSGPYKFDAARMSDARITLVRNEDGYQGTEVNFDEVVVHKGDNRQSALLVQQGEVDYSTLAPSAADQQAFQEVEGFTWIEHAGYDGVGLMFNYAAKPELEDVRVRKALARVLDGDQIGRVARGEGYHRVEYYAGLVDRQAEEIMSAQELAGLETYGQDLRKAEELLEEAGWSKEGGSWLLPDGSAAEFEIIGVAGWNDFELTATQVEEAWNGFGISTTARNVPEDNPWGIWGAGDFEVAVRHWGNPERPDHWGAFQMNFLTENDPGGEAPGQSFELQVESPSQGEVDLEELVGAAQRGRTEEERNEALRTMVIVFNELLPRIPIWGYTYLSPAVEGVRVESFDQDHPADRNEQYQDNHVMLQLIQGDLRPVQD